MADRDGEVSDSARLRQSGFAWIARSAFGGAVILASLLLASNSGAAAAGVSLPYPETPFKGRIGATRETSVTAWPEQPKAPAGAPNVVLILLDDLGFGAASSFGGPAQSPEIDRLAAEGIRYNAFNTDAICAPTRASLLTGRNHHQVGFGNLPDVAAGFPAYDGVWKADTASIAEMLKDNGYSTAAFGKWHNTPAWEISPAGPFNHWPTGLGFEYFYGFMNGESSEWEPRLYRGTSPVESTPGVHLTTALVDDAIHWIRQHEAVAPDKPFFLYFATGATHAPHQVPKAWIEKYKGKFDAGWDKISDETFARQKKIGIIPANADKTPRPAGLPAWDSLSPEQKKVYARQMEVYAGFLSHTDHQVGRLLGELKLEGIDRNTLVIYVVGDNGGSPDADVTGNDHEMGAFSAGPEAMSDQIAHMADLGSPLYDNNWSAGWAWATSTPFQWMKQVASHFGGTRNGLVIAWPGHTTHPEIVRGQFGHVNDIAPTILAAAHIPFPDSVDGVRQLPFEGVSLMPSFNDPTAPSGHHTQYFEIFGNRAIYHDGWVAASRRYEPWHLFQDFKHVYDQDFAHDKWELYHVDADYSEAHDLAAQYPDRLKALQALFDREAARNGVYPMTPMPFSGEPSIVPESKTHFDYYGGVGRLPMEAVPSLGGRSHRITAVLQVPATGAQGVIVALGGRYGGFTLYVDQGRLTYEYNMAGVVREKVVSATPLPSGRVEVAAQFDVDPEVLAHDLVPGGRAHFSGGPRPGTAQLFVAGRKVGEAHFSKFGGFSSAITETFDVGRDSGSPVSNAYDAPNAFTGRVDKISIDLTK